jgi:hypothetical protein
MWCLWKIIDEMNFVKLGDVIKKEDLRSGLGSSTIVDFAKEKRRTRVQGTRSNEIEHSYWSRTLK